MTRRVPLTRKTPLNPVSPKRAAQMETYWVNRAQYLHDHPLCERCQSCASNEVHHKAGRVGEMLTNVEYFLAVCRGCHDAIHQNMKQAEEDGWITRIR